MGQSAGVNNSEFSMWRAVFAFSLVDNVLSLEEQRILSSYKSQVPFSRQQLEVLSADFKKPQNVEMLYNQISDAKDKKHFCVLARALVWSDGDMDVQEAEILKKVACFKKPPDSDILASSRNHPHVEKYYQQYSKAGVVGLFDTPHILEMQI